MKKHELPPLPYSYDALEPYYEERTLRLHHDAHHKAYVDGLNNAEAKLAEAREKGDYALVKHWERELAFHGSGHILHSIFWTNMKPGGGGPPMAASPSASRPISAILKPSRPSFPRRRRRWKAPAGPCFAGTPSLRSWRFLRRRSTRT